MNGFMELLESGQMLGGAEILVGLLAGFVLSMALAAVYRWTYQGLSYSRSFVHTLVLGAVTSAVMIMAIGSNLARGLGILGTLAIIRFRTPIRDPRDIVFLFAALAVGIACGAGVYDVAMAGTAAFCVIALFLQFSPFASRREYEGLLRFLLPGDQRLEAEIQAVFRQFCSSAVLVGMREAAQGEMFEFSYQVRLADPSFKPDLIEALNALPGLSDTSLLMQRSTVEI